MDEQKTLTGREKASYGLGAVGKDMVYMLSASYVLYYFQDVMGVSAYAMAVILLAARVFDAFNDPIMGIIVAKTRTRMGKFRPWLLIGTLTNSVVLFAMFACPPSLDGPGLVAYAAVSYILWGVTYTMMDIPFWSMIPAFTRGGKERENLSAMARSCSGVGAAIVTILTMIAVHALGTRFGGTTANEIERLGFKWFSLIIAILFSVFIIITCVNVKEKSTVSMETATVREMFRSLIRNDQAMAVVVTIVLVNTAMYITSNLVIYFFKYDLGGTGWYNDYTLFNTVGGAAQILAMMLLYPVLRRVAKVTNTGIFYIGLAMSVIGYVILLVFASSGAKTLAFFLIPGILIMAASGINNVLTTVFLANTVDYGEISNHRRDESVIFSMQTFVVKLASGIAAFIASITLGVLDLSDSAITSSQQTVDFASAVSVSQKMGLRMVMTLLPIAGLVAAFFWFRRRYKLTDKKVEELAQQVAELHAGDTEPEV
ncbi:glycoside-pentoside-hexuronide (GPH):cation symporter [Mobilibacterium timonense]|uniref:glycoside-pentoside-hexuronide (GPH):cation symporter n=1 Tax=Mobilibacterium timonense TaxID=1871012 RepID=UPI0009867E61|nr:glycoside-pentoside-hexuronide (GPH):cation symporter [Mobilibacterium timonense]MBM6989970.1 MFS transporter [Mobilibacterium timonense]